MRMDLLSKVETAILRLCPFPTERHPRIEYSIIRDTPYSSPASLRGSVGIVLLLGLILLGCCKSRRRTLYIVGTIFAFFFLLASDLAMKQFTSSLVWRRFLYESPVRKLTNNYTAPIRLLDADRVPDSYMVFLHHGYSLEQHKETVGEAVPFDSAIKHIFPEWQRHGLHYSAILQGVELAAVRADIGVDMVECNICVYLIDSVEERDGMSLNLDYFFRDDLIPKELRAQCL